MARSDLLLSLALAALDRDLEHSRRAVESIANEEARKGHSHVADRLQHLLSAAPMVASSEVADRPSLGEGPAGMRLRPARRLVDEVRLSAGNREKIGELLKEQEHARELRAAGLEPRHRLLLVGPPGTGKTSLAEALASQLAFPFYTLQYEAIIGSFLGETASRLGRALEQAAQKPCVLFIDEFDTIAKERNDEHDAGEMKRIVSSLLLQIDAVPSHVFIVAATNHSELLDRAAWRRFQVTLELDNPDEQERREYAYEVAARVGTSDPELIAKSAVAMNGASYAAIEEMILDVRRKEVLRNLT